jgi:hypothetical protein
MAMAATALSPDPEPSVVPCTTTGSSARLALWHPDQTGAALIMTGASAQQLIHGQQSVGRVAETDHLRRM